MQEIAYYLVDNNESSLDRELAETLVSDALERFPGHERQDAAVVCRALIERSGMLREPRPGRIDFLHNTFKEYLAAERFVQRKDWGKLTARARDPLWQPVIVFSAATDEPNFASLLIRRLLNFPQPQSSATVQKLRLGEERTRQLLALQCRAVAVQLDPKLNEQLDVLISQMFPPLSMSDAEAFAQGGDTAVPHLAPLDGRSARQAAACVRALRLIGTSRAKAVLMGYLPDQRLMVVGELAQAIDPLKIPWVQQQLRSGNPLPIGVASQIKDLAHIKVLDELQSLTLAGIQATDLTPLIGLRRLKTLFLSMGPEIDLTPLAEIQSLESLGIFNSNIKGLSSLSKLNQLSSLIIIGNAVRDLSLISTFSSLKHLTIGPLSKTSDLRPLMKLAQLETLRLESALWCDLSPLTRLTSLTELSLDSTSNVDLSSLKGQTKLRVGKMSNPKELESIDVAILIPLIEEFELFQERLDEPYETIRDSRTGDYFYRFRVPNSAGHLYNCLVASIGIMGQTHSALRAEALLRFSPRTTVQIGIAGALNRDLLLGDVVMVRDVDNYLHRAKAIPGRRKENFGFELSGDHYQCSSDLVKLGNNFQFAHRDAYLQWQNGASAQISDLTERQIENLRKKKFLGNGPRLTTGRIASGEIVGSATAFVTYLLRRDRTYEALEMEAYGFLAAINNLVDPSRALILRAISDFGDERKRGLDRLKKGALRRYAMRNAVGLFLKLLEIGALPIGDPPNS